MNSSVMQNIGLVVRNRRARYNLSAQDLSVLAGVSLQVIQGLEWNMAPDVDLEDLDELARCLGLKDADDMLTRAANVSISRDEPKMLILRLSAQIQAFLDDSKISSTGMDLANRPVAADLRTVEDYRAARRWYAMKKQEFEWLVYKRALHLYRLTCQRNMRSQAGHALFLRLRRKWNL
jgi:hypothetical protein